MGKGHMVFYVLSIVCCTFSIYAATFRKIIMKVLLLVLVISLVLVSTDAFLPSKDVVRTRELVRRSAMDTIKTFLKKAMSVAGKGCSAITNYVTGPVCTAIGFVPVGTESALCGFAIEFYGICLGTVEGTRAYCDTLGSGGVPGGTALDSIVCSAIQRHG